MKRFRKKPIVIEAMLYTVENCLAIHEWMGVPHYEGGDCSDGIHINTLEGEMIARIGDWIICDIKKEFYPCKTDIFSATYEPVEESKATGPDETKEG